MNSKDVLDAYKKNNRQYNEAAYKQLLSDIKRADDMKDLPELSRSSNEQKEVQ